MNETKTALSTDDIQKKFQEMRLSEKVLLYLKRALAWLAWLGITGLCVAIGIAVFSGALFGVIARISGHLKPREPFPFGPFIALGIWLVWLMGSQWWWNQWMALVSP